MNIRQRLEKLEQQKGNADYLVLSGPDGADDEVLARWMLETGKPSPRMFVYLRRFTGTSETAT